MELTKLNSKKIVFLDHKLLLVTVVAVGHCLGQHTGDCPQLASQIQFKLACRTIDCSGPVGQVSSVVSRARDCSSEVHLGPLGHGQHTAGQRFMGL